MQEMKDYKKIVAVEVDIAVWERFKERVNELNIKWNESVTPSEALAEIVGNLHAVEELYN